MDEKTFKTYDVNDVELGETFYRNHLFKNCLNMIKYEDLPDTIPEHEIELLIARFGFVGFIEKDGGFYVVRGSESGVTPYYDLFEDFTYANPVLGSETLKIDRDVVLIRNNVLKYPSTNIVNRYAKKLSQLDSSLDIAIVNSRAMTIPVASNNKLKTAITTLYESLKKGFYTALVSNDMNFEKVDFLPTSPDTGYKSITELATLRNNELRQFWREFGVNMSKDKSQTILSDETSSDEEYLKMVILNTLEIRKRDFEKVNNLFGLNIKPYVSESFYDVIAKTHDKYGNLIEVSFVDETLTPDNNDNTDDIDSEVNDDDKEF